MGAVHTLSFPRKIREKLKLNRPDAGWYQVRNALKLYAETEFTDLDRISTVHAALTTKLRPQVYSLGFLTN